MVSDSGPGLWTLGAVVAPPCSEGFRELQNNGISNRCRVVVISVFGWIDVPPSYLARGTPCSWL